MLFTGFALSLPFKNFSLLHTEIQECGGETRLHPLKMLREVLENLSECTVKTDGEFGVIWVFSRVQIQQQS